MQFLKKMLVFDFGFVQVSLTFGQVGLPHVTGIPLSFRIWLQKNQPLF